MTQHSRKACILQGKNVETGHFSVWGKVSVCVCVWGGGEGGCQRRNRWHWRQRSSALQVTAAGSGGRRARRDLTDGGFRFKARPETSNNLSPSLPPQLDSCSSE